MDRQTSRWEGRINGENWTLQPSGADIRYIASSKLTHLQSSEVLLSTFYTCWHLSCVCPQFGLWGKSLCEVNKEPCPTPADRFLSLRLSLLFPTGESFQCFHLISAALILLQHLMFHGVTDRGGLRSSAGAAYCRLSEFIDQRQHNMSKRGLVGTWAGENVHRSVGHRNKLFKIYLQYITGKWFTLWFFVRLDKERNIQSI